jgi:hypothetical protein
MKQRFKRSLTETWEDCTHGVEVRGFKVIRASFGSAANASIVMQYSLGMELLPDGWSLVFSVETPLLELIAR